MGSAGIDWLANNFGIDDLAFSFHSSSAKLVDGWDNVISERTVVALLARVAAHRRHRAALHLQLRPGALGPAEGGRGTWHGAGWGGAMYVRSGGWGARAEGREGKRGVRSAQSSGHPRDRDRDRLCR